MIRLVDDLLDVSRISQGKITLRTEDIEPKKVISDAIETAKPVIEHRRHKLSVILPPYDIWMHGDSVRLSQVVCNLLNNATKFTPPGGEHACRFHPDIIFLNIGLPDMTGFQVAARLRELSVTKNAIIVALTGYGQEKTGSRRSPQASTTTLPSRSRSTRWCRRFAS
jgi:CheY-like chemotaxis protein